jgi:hypothetical protein
MQKVMNWLWTVILAGGLAVLALGIMLIVSVPGANSQLATEVARPAGTTVGQVDALYEQAKAGMEQMYAATGGEAAVNPDNPLWDTYWQAANTATAMGLVKSNLGTIQMTTVLGIVNIITGFTLMSIAAVAYGTWTYKRREVTGSEANTCSK